MYHCPPWELEDADVKYLRYATILALGTPEQAAADPFADGTPAEWGG